MSNDAKKYLDSEGLSYFWDKIKDYVGEAVESGTSNIANKIHFVAPNEKEATAALTASVSDVDALSPGLVIALRMPFDSVASQTLNINNLGAKPIYYRNNTTDAEVFPSGAVVLLIYETTSVGTGCFKAVYSYDAAQPNVYQGAAENANGVAGLVPAAASAERSNFLRGDGTWAEIMLPSTLTAAEVQTGTDNAGKLISAKVLHDYAIASNTDTKVNVTLGTTTKAYLLGTSTTPTSTATGVTAISDTGVYLDTTAGRLTAASFAGNVENGTLATANAVVVTNASKKLAASTTITTTELGYLDGVTSSIQTQLNGKAASSHTHASSEVTAMTSYSKPSSTSAIATTDSLNDAIGKLEKALDGKAASSHGTHVTYSTSNPLVAGTASAGSANNVSRGDHVHPEQTIVKQSRGVFLVIPNETTQTATLTATVSGITEYFPGLMVAYRAPFNTAASSTLNINSLGAKPIYYGVNTTSKDYYPANRVVLLVYETTTTSGGCWKMVYSYDGNSNTYDRRLHNNAVKAATAVTAGTIIVGTSAGYKQAASGITFDLQYPILYASAAIAANATATNTYEAIPSINLQTTKASWTGTQYSTAFLVGTLSGNTVTIDSSVFTTTVPSSADGKVYIPIGVLYSTYQVYFAPEKDIYQYTNGSFHLLDTTTAAAGSSNGQVKINGTDVTVYTHPTTSGNKHVPSGGSSGQFLGWSADGTAAWVGNPNWTTHLYAGAASDATANATSATTNAATYIVVCDNSTARNAVQVTGTNGTTVSAVNGKLTIDSPALASVTNAQIDTLFA